MPHPLALGFSVRRLLGMAGFALLLTAATAKPADAADAYLPRRDDEVLEHLEPTAKRIAVRSAKAAGLREALVVARQYVEEARRSGNPRYYGRAEAMLAKWTQAERVPPQALLMRAIIRQGLHDFSGALQDLEGVLTWYRFHPQALLTKASILLVQGRREESAAACRGLVAPSLTFVREVCLAAALSIGGESENSLVALEALLNAGMPADPAVEVWAMTLAAEIADRLGRAERAEHWFNRAYAVDPRDHYLAVAYADFLLARDRHAEARKILAAMPETDSVLLRRAAAAKKAGEDKEFAAAAAQLAERFGAAERSREHAREAALYYLDVVPDAGRALALAELNWQVQREPVDLRLLARAAAASKPSAARAAAVDELRSWVREHSYRDEALERILSAEGGGK